MANRDYGQVHRKYFLIALMVVAILAVVVAWVAFALLDPTPPRTIAMATDPEGSVSSDLGKRYRDILARSRVEVRLVPSVGAVENVALLRDPKSGVSVSIIPSGITNAQQSPDLASLGTLFYEPLWLFHRAPEGLKRHEDFSGRTISIGLEGSGTHALAVEFLARVGIVDEQNAKLLPLPPEVATEKLLHGEIDAVAMLAA